MEPAAAGRDARMAWLPRRFLLRAGEAGVDADVRRALAAAGRRDEDGEGGEEEDEVGDREEEVEEEGEDEEQEDEV